MTNEKRLLLVEKFQNKTKIPYKILFPLGLLYLFFLEFIVVHYYLDVPFHYYLVVAAIGWTFLWLFALKSMFYLRKKAFTTIDRLKDIGFYNESLANKLKDKFFNFPFTEKSKWSLKKTIYVLLFIILSIGIVVSIHGMYSVEHYTWIIDTEGGTHHISEAGVEFYILFNVVHWVITVLLTVLIFDIVVIVFAIGLLTKEILKHIKGKLDFYNADGFGGISSIGDLMSATILIYFISLSFFSVLLGLYNDLVYLVYIALAWIIGIILIMRLQTLVRNVIREDKDRMIKEIVRKIKDLENRKSTSSTKILEKISDLAYLNSRLSIVKSTDENIFNLKTKTYSLFPIATTVLDYLIRSAIGLR